jgi:hypothetical protein
VAKQKPESPPESASSRLQSLRVRLASLAGSELTPEASAEMQDEISDCVNILRRTLARARQALDGAYNDAPPPE